MARIAGDVFQVLVLSSVILTVTCLSLPVEGKTSFGKLPEEDLNVTQLIQYWGYPCEVHEVTTEDGYVLSVQRIPYGLNSTYRDSPRHVVFLQHGLVASSADWIMNLPSKSLGFMLADAGYDVWMGNVRGNTYSRKHIKYTTKDAEFWNFSFDEMAKYDLPAMLNYALNVTHQPDLYYVGHSQGTTIAFAEFSRNNELAKKVKTFFALAPVATVGHIKGALKLLSYFGPEIEFMLGVREFLPSNWLMDILADMVCGKPVTEVLCESVLFLMAGFDRTQLNETRLPVYVSHAPAGTSTKNILHFGQMVKSGKFQAYDYGEKGNKKHYNQANAPEYSVKEMETPVAVFTGGNDWLADPYDVYVLLFPHLKNVIFRKDVKNWNHLDFVWGEDANKLIYTDIINLMKKDASF